MPRFIVERLEHRYLLSANPANLEAAPVSDHQIELRWTTSPQSNPTGLWVQRAQGDSAFQTITGVLSTTTSFTDSNLSPITTYRYRVWEQNPDGSSDYSNFASAAPNPSQLSREAVDLGRETTAGTHLVKNLAPNTNAPRRLTFLASADGSLVFGTNNPGQPDTQEVWKSDGTQAGTTQLATGNLDFVGSAAGTWFFVGTAGLWASDQTPAGTKLIAPSSVGPLGIAGHRLFFDPSPQSTLGPLWVTDGTTAGTMQIGSQTVYAYYGYYRASGNYLYFMPSQPGTSGNPGLYRTDGTVAGTRSSWPMLRPNLKP